MRAITKSARDPAERDGDLLTIPSANGLLGSSLILVKEEPQSRYDGIGRACPSGRARVRAVRVVRIFMRRSDERNPGAQRSDQTLLLAAVIQA